MALQPLRSGGFSTLSGERYVNEAPLKLVGQRIEVSDESREKPVSATCFKPATETRWSTRPLQRVVVGSRPEKAELHGQTCHGHDGAQRNPPTTEDQYWTIKEPRGTNSRFFC